MQLSFSMCVCVCVCVGGGAVLVSCHNAHSKQLDVFVETVYVLLLFCCTKGRDGVPELHSVKSHEWCSALPHLTILHPTIHTIHSNID